MMHSGSSKPSASFSAKVGGLATPRVFLDQLTWGERCAVGRVKGRVTSKRGSKFPKNAARDC